MHTLTRLRPSLNLPSIAKTRGLGHVVCGTGPQPQVEGNVNAHVIESVFGLGISTICYL